MNINARRCAGLLALALAFAASPAAAQTAAQAQPAVQAQAPNSAGRVKVATGDAFIVRQGNAVKAQPGQAIFESDSIRTGADGNLGVTLKDDTRVSIGPNSEVRLDKFAYAPADGNLALALKFVKGMAAYVSGRIAKLAPDAIRLETPGAIVGVRGTSLAIKVDE